MSTITEDMQQLTPGNLVTWFELDASEIGGGVIRFHGNQGMPTGYWQNNEYAPWAISAEGFARTSDQQPTPKLMVGNVDGSISLLCLSYEDLVGAKVIRRRTFTKYIDARNFDGPQLIDNGTFDTDLGGWSINAGTVAWSNGEMAIGDNVTTSSVLVPFDVEAGKSYRLRFDTAAAVVGTNIGTVFGGADVLPAANGVIGQTIRDFTAATTGKYWLRVYRGVTGIAARVDNVSIREIGVNPTEDFTQEFPPEVWFIERKSGESREAVEFELASALDFQGIKLPRRQIIANQCGWQYREDGCNYIGPPVADILDNPTSDPLLDKCGRRYSSCKLRQWPDGILNFGGFLAAGMVRV